MVALRDTVQETREPASRHFKEAVSTDSACYDMAIAMKESGEKSLTVLDFAVAERWWAEEVTHRSNLYAH